MRTEPATTTPKSIRMASGGWPGIGRLALNAVFRRDYLVVTGTVLVFSIMVIAVNLVTDIMYSYIDPRIRYQ